MDAAGIRRTLQMVARIWYTEGGKDKGVRQ